MEFTVKAKRWGKFLAFIIPDSITQRELIKADDEVVIEIKSARDHRRLFGMLRGRSKQSTQSIKDEMREGWQ